MAAKLKKQNNTISLRAEGDINAGNIVAGDLVLKREGITDEDINRIVERLSEKLQNPSIENLNKNIVSYHTPTHVSQAISAKISQAEKLQKSYEFRTAIDLYISILTSEYDKLNDEVMFSINNNLGICYFNLRDNKDNLDKSKEFFDKALRHKKGQEVERVHLTMSWYYFELKDFPKALFHAQEAIRLKPDYTKALNILALLRHKNGELPEAIISDMFLDEKGNIKGNYISDASILSCLGQLCLFDNRYDDALDYFEKAIEIDGNSFGISALLGEACLIKGLGSSKALQDININRDISLDFIDKALFWFQKAFRFARDKGLEKSIEEFALPYTVARMLRGRYDQAYQDIARWIEIGISSEDLLLQKAKIEAVKGDFVSAKETILEVNSQNAKIDESIFLIGNGNYEKAIHLLNELVDDIVDKETNIFAHCLLIDAYLISGKIDKALLLLKSSEKKENTNWRIELMWAKYYHSSDNFNEAEKHIINALELSNYHQQALFESVEIYGQNKKYCKIIDLLENVISDNLPSKYIYQNTLFSQLIKAYYLNKDYHKAIHKASEALSSGVPEKKLQDLLSEAYIKIKDYGKALKIYENKIKEFPKEYENRRGMADISLLMGRAEESIEHYRTAESMAEANSDFHLFMNYSQALFLCGDKEGAAKAAKAAKDIGGNIPSSEVHPFYAVMMQLCGETNAMVQHMAKYHAQYPKERWLRSIKAIETNEFGEKKLSDEFLTTIGDAQKHIKNAIRYYKNNPVTLKLLSDILNNSFKQTWDMRLTYSMPIYVDMGNKQLQQLEHGEMENATSVMLDYLTLLIANEYNLIDKITNSFEKIYLPQKLFDDIQMDLLRSNDEELLKLWNTIRNHPKIYFLPKEIDALRIDFEAKDAIGEAFTDGLNITLNKNILYCISEDRLKRFAMSEINGNVSGLHSLLAKLLAKNQITYEELGKIKASLIKENYEFISFNENEMLGIAIGNDYKFNEEIALYFKALLKGNPDINSFIIVYLKTIIVIIEKNENQEEIKPWIKAYCDVFSRLQTRLNGLLYLIDAGVIDAEKIDHEIIHNQGKCFYAIEWIVAIIYFFEKDTEKRRKYLSYIKSGIVNEQLYIGFDKLVIEGIQRSKNMDKNIFQ